MLQLTALVPTQPWGQQPQAGQFGQQLQEQRNVDDMSSGESQFGEFEAFACPLVAEFQSRSKSGGKCSEQAQWMSA